MVKLPVKYPAKAYYLKSSEAIVVIHPCCICGKSKAPFGKGSKLRGGNKSLGYWFCGKSCEKVFDKKFPDSVEKPISQSLQLELF